MTQKWYNLSPEQCASRLNTNIKDGLDLQSVKKRRKEYGVNKVFHIPNASIGECLRACGGDISIYLMIAMVLMSSLFKQNYNSIVMLCLILINFLTIFFAYHRSKSNLSKMAKFTMPMSRVVREGKIFTVKQTELVVGDLVLLGVGDIVPCDCRIISSDILTVMEPDIKGRKNAKNKNSKIIYGENIPYDERTNMLYATSVITKGEAVALACGCGDSTFVRATNQENVLVNHRDLRVIRTLRKYSGIWSTVMITLIAVICTLDLVLGLETRGLFDIFLTAAALCCSAMSQSYVIFAYIIVGHNIEDSVHHTGEINTGAVVKNISSFEKLKDIDTLIVHKKGGFFASTSTIEKIFTSDILHKANEKKLASFCTHTLKWALLSTGFESKPGLFTDTATEAYAIAMLSNRIGIDPNICAIENPLICVGSILNEIGCESAILSGDGSNTAVIRGEAAPVLEHCTHYYYDGKKRAIDSRHIKKINEALKAIDISGLRAIAVATKKTMATSFDDVADGDWVLEGILGIREPILAGAGKTLSECREAGIHIIVLTDDEPDKSARLYFKRLGLISSDKEIMTSSVMSAMKNDMFRANIPLYNMYEGLTLSQKRLLVSHLKSDGHTIGIMGSELEDIILMNESDIGFSCVSSLASRMPKLRENVKLSRLESCEALRLTSDVLISSPDDPRGGFNAVVKSIKEAKSLYQDIMHMTKYLLTSQIARFVILLYSIIVRNSHIDGINLLSPAQILFLGLIVDLGIVISIALQKPPSDILNQKETTEFRLENPLSFGVKSCIFGLFWGIITIAIPVIFKLAGIVTASEQMSSMVFISLVISQLCCAFETLYENSVFKGISPVNKFMLGFSGLCFVFTVILSLISPVGSLFDVDEIGIIQWICLFIPAAIMVTVYEIYKNIKH